MITIPTRFFYTWKPLTTIFNFSAAAENDPDEGRDIHEANEVNVVINSIENGRDEELD